MQQFEQTSLMRAPLYVDALVMLMKTVDSSMLTDFAKVANVIFVDKSLQL